MMMLPAMQLATNHMQSRTLLCQPLTLTGACSSCNYCHCAPTNPTHQPKQHWPFQLL
jgi:hypothetical protein